MQRRTPLAVDDVRAILSNPVVVRCSKSSCFSKTSSSDFPPPKGLATLDGVKSMENRHFFSHTRRFQRSWTVGKMAVCLLLRSWCSPFKQVLPRTLRAHARRVRAESHVAIVAIKFR